MGKVSPITALWGVFCVWVAIFLSGCVQPVNLNAFVENKEVQEIIEKGAGSVNITVDSESDLRAGDKKISNLDPQKYYMVEEWEELIMDGKSEIVPVTVKDENGDPVNAVKDKNGRSVTVRYVGADGGLSTELVKIGLVTGKEITGLKNDHYYRVKAAGPLSNSGIAEVSYTVILPADNQAKTRPIVGGVTTLLLPKGESFAVFSLTPPPSPPGYEIVQLPISPEGSASLARLQAGNIITPLADKDTEIDYVFFGSIDEIDPFRYFYCVKVKVKRADDIVDLTSDSDPGLVADDEKIINLDPNKYYMVEEWDDETPPNDPAIWFVGADGKLSARLVDIGLVTGTEITGLKNGNSYRVKAAKPLTDLPGVDEVSYTVLLPPDNQPRASAIEDGAITLPLPKDASLAVYALTPPLAPPAYDIAQIPVSPAGSALLVSLQSGKIRTPAVEDDTEIDYLFVGSSPNVSFYVLKVQVCAFIPEPEEGLNIVVGFTTGENDPDPIITATSVTYSQNYIGTITFAVPGTEYSGFIWYIDGNEQTGETSSSFDLVLDNSDDTMLKYRIAGTYIITVFATKDSRPYSATIEVTVE